MKNESKKYEIIIGLEIHVQLKTKSKMFCGCDNTGEDQPANTTICPVCTGQPGVLPVANQPAIDWAIAASLALNGEVASAFKFDRKSYFYPDLPKGYQISQYDQPIAKNGFLVIESEDGQVQKVGIERLHLEEDAAKLLHSAKGEGSLIDFNRAGTPLLEIVTKPEIRSSQAAKLFMQELRLIMRYLNISEANMEKGHLRCDANISLRPVGETKLYPKTEIKNLNSFRSVEKALAYEVERQTKLWQEGNPPKELSTRGWDEKAGKTVEQRTKEEISDYRYFPEPDLPPFKLTSAKIAELKAGLGELPAARRLRLTKEYGLAKEEARILVQDQKLGDYAEKVILKLGKGEKGLAKMAASWLINKLGGLMSTKNLAIDDLKISPEDFSAFIRMIQAGEINTKNAQEVLELMVRTGQAPGQIVSEKDLGQLSGEKELEKVIEKVIEANPEPVADYQKGKTNILQYLIGQVMKETKGRANPEVIKGLLERKLK